MMSKVAWFISYKLRKGVSVEDFLVAFEKCHNEVVSKQKGFISWEVLRDADTWVEEQGYKAVNTERKYLPIQSTEEPCLPYGNANYPWQQCLPAAAKAQEITEIFFEALSTYRTGKGGADSIAIQMYRRQNGGENAGIQGDWCLVKRCIT